MKYYPSDKDGKYYVPKKRELKTIYDYLHIIIFASIAIFVFCFRILYRGNGKTAAAIFDTILFSTIGIAITIIVANLHKCSINKYIEEINYIEAASVEQLNALDAYHYEMREYDKKLYQKCED